MFVLLLPSCRYGHFSGINRKVQLTYLPHGQPKTSSEEEGAGMSAESSFVGQEVSTSAVTRSRLFSSADFRKEGPSLLLVLKWGGELTPAGRVQAEELGRAFRCMYPGGQGEATPTDDPHVDMGSQTVQLNSVCAFVLVGGSLRSHDLLLHVKPI